MLADFPEGLLGKLQIRKSGKVELKMGDIIMDVSEGAAFSFLQVICECVVSGFYVGAHEVVFWLLNIVYHDLKWFW